MYIVKQKKFAEQFEKFEDACKKARILGNGGEVAYVYKNEKELYRTR